MSTETNADTSKVVTLSAPGKILMAGGYLVLESPNIGLVVAADKRFYTTVKALSEPSPVSQEDEVTLSSDVSIFLIFGKRKKLRSLFCFVWTGL